MAYGSLEHKWETFREELRVKAMKDCYESRLKKTGKELRELQGRKYPYLARDEDCEDVILFIEFEKGIILATKDEDRKTCCTLETTLEMTMYTELDPSYLFDYLKVNGIPFR